MTQQRLRQHLIDM